MGVQGLLPMLKSVMDHVNVAKYKGKTVGIDAAGWLYKGCYSCAADVVLGKDTDVYLNFCVQQIKQLQELGIRPLFVFDGAPLPAKAALNASRYRMREIWRQKALRAVEQAGEGTVPTNEFNKAVSVSNAMIMKLIALLRRMSIDFLVAPYEADAQLAYLSKLKIVDAVISEDSDCIPYGCRTTLFKWSADGWASELKRRSLGANEDLSFVGWTEEMFVQLCVLCGCDYCPSIPGVGIVTAYKLVNTHKKPIEVVAALKEQKKEAISSDFENKFYTAILTFRHHLVFDPRDEKLKMLNPLSVSGDLIERVDKSLSFLGNLELKDSLAASIAYGSIHPVTHESYAWKETAELQSLTWPGEETFKSLTSSETSSDPEICIVRSSIEKLGSAGSNRVAAPVTDEDEDEGDLQNRNGRPVGKKPTLTSWRHLDSVLGTSAHILNFRSPKVSENFRSLVSVGSRKATLHAEKTVEEMKAFGEAPCRSNLKRVRNPRNRNRDDQKSGFDGEVTCRVDMSDPVTQRSSQRRRLSTPATHAAVLSKPAMSNYIEGLEMTRESFDRGPARPQPFFATNRQYHEKEVSHIQNPRTRPLSVSGSEGESEEGRSVSSPRSNGRPAFNAVSARRAMSAEEKWDRILEPEIGSSDIEEGESVPQAIESPGSA